MIDGFVNLFVPITPTGSLADRTMATNKDKGESKPPDGSRSKRRFPQWLLVLALLGLVVSIVAKTFASEIESATGIDPVSINIFIVLLFLVFSLIWMLVFLYRNSIAFLPRLLIALFPVCIPLFFFFVLRPVNSGDGIGVHHFEPIGPFGWLLGREGANEPEMTIGTSKFAVDLSTETDGDFAQFLGPNRNAVLNHLPPIDPGCFESETIELWKQPVGEGWSSFAVRNGYAITMEQREPGELEEDTEDEPVPNPDGDSFECVTCYDVQSGKMQWIYKHPGRHRDLVSLGRIGPRATPIIHDGRVYAMGANGHFVCLDGADGSLLWKHDLAEMLGVKLYESKDSYGLKYAYEENSSLAWGHAGSPLIINDMVVIPGGGPIKGGKITLLGFDLESGQKVWQAGTDMISYSSPVRMNLCGIDQIVIVLESAAAGYAVDDGRELWKYDREGTSNGAANCSQVTAAGEENQLILSKGYGVGGALIELELDGSEIAVDVIKTDPRVLKTKLTNPVVKDGHAYCLSDGYLECSRVEDLTRMWKRRGRFGHGQLLLVGDLLLVHSEYGELFLVEANPDEFVELGKIETIDGVCWNTLCLAGNYLLVRSDVEAACYKLPIAGSIQSGAPDESDSNE